MAAMSEVHVTVENVEDISAWVEEVDAHIKAVKDAVSALQRLLGNGPSLRISMRSKFDNPDDGIPTKRGQ